ncbi:ATP-grasp domain-containing protein [Streptococcus pneumoniae]|uniref:ATP-grasp domain-containing protein n=1 Tax=Streptococcus pneumoniae TaxID=1313 RepID=UPI0007695A0A|nr:ATP-grasp domain-containing protein [Streptococcus pneumoniae]CZE33127.1 nikkomycin biosynthesis protein%2C carboxylase [Streptococcus pneumoniae]
MKLLLLCNHNPKLFGLDKWLYDYHSNEIIILTSAKKERLYSKYEQNINVFLSYVEKWTEEIIAEQAKILYESFSYDRIIALDEFDVYIAAKIRNFLGIEGQSVESARFFRDKYYMTKKVKSFGFPVAHTEKIDNYLDVYNFGRRNGYPFVVKPNLGAGTVDTYIINSEFDIKKLVKYNFQSNQFICQEKLNGNLFHIDVLVNDDYIEYINVSRYLHPTIEYQNNKSSASVTLTEKDVETKVLRCYTEKLIRAIPTYRFSLLHLEVFYDGNEVYFLEIASRLGGGGVHRILNDQYGFDPQEVVIKLEMGEEFSNFPKSKLNDYYGFIMVIPNLGRICSLPSEKEISEYLKENNGLGFQCFTRLGYEYSTIHSSVHSLYEVSFKGDSYQDLVDKLQNFESWVKSRIIYT